MKATGFLLVALAAVPSAPAFAQAEYEKETGSQIAIPKRAEAPEKKLSGEELAREMMNQFARCIVDRSPAQVAEAIALPPGEDAQSFNRASTDECLQGGTMRFSPAVIRGAVFGELYRRQQKGAKGLAERFPIRPLDWSAPPPLAGSARARTNYFMLSVADCLKGSSGEAMRGVVMNPAGSSAQNKAYEALIPALGPCVPEGQTLTFSRSMLEAAFGEYLYRSLVPAIPAASSEKAR